MKKILIYDIEYDTDGEDVLLPDEITVDASEFDDVELEGADYISDMLGWCVVGFQYKYIGGNEASQCNGI